jgi:hypothetical protein
MSNIQKRLDKVIKSLDQRTISKVAFDKFKEVTPEASGNAKRNTKLKRNVIEANYQYAAVLNKGRHMTNRGMRGSNQAPEGMLKPTVEHIRQYILKQLGINL